MADSTGRRKEVGHDEAPSIISSHPFEPKKEWWSVCKYCEFAESAHTETTILPFHDVTDAWKIFPR